MTQQELIINYIREFGSMLPAKMGGRSYRDGFFGSETSKRCRELRKSGQLISRKEGRFERFFLKDPPMREVKVLDDFGNVLKVIKVPYLEKTIKLI